MSFEKIRSLTQLISIRWRLTIIFVAVFGTTLVLFSVFVFKFLSTTLQREFDDALYNYAVDVSETVTLDASGDLSLHSPTLERTKLYPFSLGTALVQIRHTNGKIFTQVGDFGSLNVPYHREIDRLSQGEEVVFRTISKLEGLPNKEAEEYRMVTLPIDNSPVPQILLQVAVPMTLLDDQITNRKFVFEFSLPIALLIAVFGGYFLSTRAMRPVTEMISTANAIGAEKLQARLPVPFVRDEIQALAISLNDMLTRIEKAFASQERFIADASHQLLTPLTIIRGEIESTLRQPSSVISQPVQDLLHSNLQEVDQLSTIVQQLLLLARVDAGKGALQLSELALDEVVLDAIARANRFAQQKNIRIQFNIDNQSGADSRPMIKGDYDLLQNLAFNLIENAIKYSPQNEVVKVTLLWSPTHQKISIENKGKGIPEDQMGLIFERFHRADSSNKGYGLGLAIAKKISDVHSAVLEVRNNYANLQDKTEAAGCCFSFEIKNI